MALETKALLLEAERARLFDHNTNRGSEAEHSILRWLRARFAPDYAVSSGEIIDSFDTNAGINSRQQDGILHRNNADANRFLLPSGMRLVPIETVAAVVEVKLTLTKAEFEKADRAAAETARLRLRPHRDGQIVEKMDDGSNTSLSLSETQVRDGLAVSDDAFGEPPAAFTVFSFGGVEELDTLRGWLNDASTISVVCCLSAGCLVRGGYMRAGHMMIGSPDGDIEATAEDALWHFSETVGRLTAKHGAVVRHLRPDFDGYAPYAKALHLMTTVASDAGGGASVPPPDEGL